MLYFLKRIDSDTTFYLVKKDKFIVGRKECDFLIENDPSISRRHAAIQIQDGSVIIEDLESKYHTLHNGHQLSSNRKQQLNVKDTIKFGILNSIFILEQIELITTGTHLSTNNKDQLKSALKVLGGSYVESWTVECTHLTVQNITVTGKLLLALLDNKPIVTQNYWTAFAENISKHLPPPDINKYNNPPIAEPLLKNIDFKSMSRRGLFQGKIFIFASEHSMKDMEEIIKKAGGSCKCWEKDNILLSNILDSPTKFLVVKSTSLIETSSSYKDMIAELIKQGKRPILIQEIAMAVITGNCEKDCNPSFDRASTVFMKVSPVLPSQSGALAPDTESDAMEISLFNETQKCIPSTFDPQDLQTQTDYNFTNPGMHSSVKSEDDIRQQKKRKNDDINKNAKTIKLDNGNTDDQLHKHQTQDIERESPGTTILSLKRKLINSPEPLNDSNVQKNPFAFYKKIKTESTETTSKERLIEASHPVKEEPNNTKSEKNTINRFWSRSRSSSVASDTSNISSVIEKNIFSTITTRYETVSNTTAIFHHQTNSELEDSIPWLSNLTIKGENVEREIKDPDLRRYIEAVRDTFIVEPMPESYFMRPKRYNSEDEIVQSGLGKRNFKLFKKVLPKYPQTKVVQPDCVIVLNTGED